MLAYLQFKIFWKRINRIISHFFPDVSNRIKNAGKYKLQLLSEEKVEKFNQITLDFLDFLNEISALTPGTDETLPSWVTNLADEKEKEERKRLHYTYGTANALLYKVIM